MNLVHIVGRKNHGKTTLIVELLAEFSRRGIPVGSIKHSPHVHELDTIGKDSYRHRIAGAAPVAVITAGLVGVYLPNDGQSVLAKLTPLFDSCRLVLVEGYVDGPGRKIEVWRAAQETPPLAHEYPDVAAVVSDDCPTVDVPVWPRRDIAAVAEKILQFAVD